MDRTGTTIIPVDYNATPTGADDRAKIGLATCPADVVANLEKSGLCAGHQSLSFQPTRHGCELICVAGIWKLILHNLADLPDGRNFHRHVFRVKHPSRSYRVPNSTASNQRGRLAAIAIGCEHCWVMTQKIPVKFFPHFVIAKIRQRTGRLELLPCTLNPCSQPRSRGFHQGLPQRAKGRINRQQNCPSSKRGRTVARKM